MKKTFEVIKREILLVIYTILLASCTLITTQYETAETELTEETELTDMNKTQTAVKVYTSTALVADFIDQHGVKMKLIPAGGFQMGSESGCCNQIPIHTVYLDTFYMDIYEVTNRLYRQCVEAGVCAEPYYSDSYTRKTYYVDSAYDEYPVIYVNWEDAQKYCEWHQARLPTEAEWEKAARGGLEGKDYPWGDGSPVCLKGAARGAKFDDDAGCNDADTEPVGSYAPNGYGLYDMAGNVYEWVWDWYKEDYYSQSPIINPQGPDSGYARVTRGGSWGGLYFSLYVWNRNISIGPKFSDWYLGFRCSRFFRK